MSRIEARFQKLRAQQRKALIPYVTAGDPRPEVTVPLLHALVQAGADIVEIGVPFSDPMADGPVIQAACERALVHHISLHDVLDMVREFRRRDDATPIVLMGYLNPIEVWGYQDFAAAAAVAGVDGVLTVDMPPEEGAGLAAALHDQGLDAIFLLAPTSSPSRIQTVCRAASGFVYYVSFKGVTGANRLDVKLGCRQTRGDPPLHGIARGCGFRHPRPRRGRADCPDCGCGGGRQRPGCKNSHPG